MPFFENLIEMFAYWAGKEGGQFYTPSEVAQLLVRLLKPAAGMSVYDPAVGTGGMLIQARNYLAKQGENPDSLLLFGQEMNLDTWAICNMNMFSNGVNSADIRHGDTLGNPQHTQGDALMTFDRVIANPLFSLHSWSKKENDNDVYGRFPYGIPPKNAGGLALVQHMIASLSAEGMMGVVMLHGVLCRRTIEKTIREGILNDDLLEALIGLPAALFIGADISASLMIINKNKPVERQGKVLFINAELEYEEGRKQNKLRAQDLDKIVATFDDYEEIKRYSRIVTLEEVSKNDFNLNIASYVDTSPMR